MSLKILRLPALCEKIGKSASTIYEEIAAGTFPKPIKLGRQSVGWPENEIEDWLRGKIAERDAASTGLRSVAR